jgi:hypothetical protein
VVVSGDSAILEPPVPLPFSGRDIRFEPTGDGGYATALLPGAPIQPRGKLFRFATAENAATRIELLRPILFYGVPYRELYVYPQGVVTLGQPFADGIRASAADASRLAPDLLSGPAAIAPLWNELVPNRIPPGGGVFVAQWDGVTSVIWMAIPSMRPADAPNTFQVVFHADGAIDPSTVRCLRNGESWGSSRRRACGREWSRSTSLISRRSPPTWRRSRTTATCRN